MNHRHLSSFGSTGESENPISPSKIDQFRSILKNLPRQESPPKRKRKSPTKEDLVAEFYPLLEKARIEKGYTYEQLAELFQKHLQVGIAKDSLRKYMGKLRRHQRQSSTPQATSSSKTVNRANQTDLPPSPLTNTSSQRAEKEKPSNPAQRLPKHLMADPSQAFRTTRTKTPES